MDDVYINRVAKFLPNDPVSNDEMEGILGMINGRPSRSRRIVLRHNGIKTRHYAINKRGERIYNNAQLVAEAIRQLAADGFTLQDMELLCCGTSTPDQLTPSHASMVHGLLQNRPMEINSPSGVCCAGMQAYKYGYLSVKSGSTANAVCAGSEAASYAMLAHHFAREVEELQALEERPVLSFEKDFLRWMLSDGAGAVLMENKPRDGLSLRVEWVESTSFANELDVCMSAACTKNADGVVQHWLGFGYDEIAKESMWCLRQSVELLNQHVVHYAVKALLMNAERHNTRYEDVDYYVPHLSSIYFKQLSADEMERQGVGIPMDKWFINLDRVGNVGAASVYLALEELFHSGRLKRGQKILLGVPESGRFMYVSSMLTVC
jgi:3-oxoacyl-[acyl-carrier-protein] synthase-3